MAGERNLTKLLKSIEPRLDPVRYVFCTVTDPALLLISATTPLATFQEDEGLCLVLREEQAKRDKLDSSAVFKRITLRTHSSLEAVGLTVSVSTCLAEHGISANIIAAYHHDHIFVPADHADQALALLKSLGGP